MNLTPGSYKARAISPAIFQKSSQKETPGVTVSLRLEEGPNKGAIIEWSGWLSDAAKARTVEALVLMGFDGEDPNTVTKSEIIAVLDNEQNDWVDNEGKSHTQVQTRVKWINDPNRSGGAKFIPLSDAERVAIAGDIRASVAAQKAAAVPVADPLQFPSPDVANGPKPKF